MLSYANGPGFHRLAIKGDQDDSGQAFADANLKLEVVELRLSLLLMFMLRNMLATVGADLVTKLKSQTLSTGFG